MTMAITQGAEIASASRLRSARRCAALLVVAWAFSGLWEIGHAFEHERDHKEHHAAADADGLDASTTASHDHDHSHPESSPVASTGRRPDVGAPALLVAAAHEDPCPTAPRLWWSRSEPACASPGHSSASGPRAPPLS